MKLRSSVGLVLTLSLAIGLTTVFAQEPAPTDNPAPTSAESETAARARVKQLVRYEPTEFEVDASPPTGQDLLVQVVRYPSPYESTHPDPNDTVHARFFRLKEPSKAGLIVLGGWRRDPITPALAFALAKSGIQILYISIPFQERRTPRGRQPGELTLSADLDQTEATFVQLAQDVDRGRKWLVDEHGVDPERIGLLGTSLGGFASASLFGMDGGFKCAVIQLAGADIAGVLFNGNFLTRGLAQQLAEKGVSEAAARKRLRGLSPDLWADPKRKDDLLLVAAEHDTIVPLETVEKLAELYGGARVEVLPDQRHIAPRALQTNLPTVEQFLVDRLLTKEERVELGHDPDGEDADEAPEDE